MDDNARSLAEQILKSFLTDDMSYEDARKRTQERLSPYVPGIRVVLDEFDVERERKIHSRTKLTEIGTSRRRDLRAMGWYTGVDGQKGVWDGLRRRMIENGLADAVEQIHTSTEEIVASTAQPHVTSDKRLGLVIGNVQSGKTANFSAVISKALDSGYKFVLVLAGIHNNLRRQTQLRLERDLGLDADAQHWHKLTDADADFGKHETRNATSIVSNNARVLAVVKKNSSRLQNVLDFLRALDERARASTPFLIIDDESDQATPDSSAGIEDEPTKINRLLRELWSRVGNGTYIGYTATPFANVFMDPNSENGAAPAELYPKDFIHVMPTPKNYFGAERIFGLDGDPSDLVAPDVVRRISDVEISDLAPRDGLPRVTASLGDAIRWFVVATAIRRVRGQHDKHSTMLIHTTARVDPHFAMRDAVREFLEPYQRAAREGDVETFREIFHQERDRAAELYTGHADAPVWPRVSREIPNVLRALRLSVDNGRADATERLSYADGPQTVIVIGGSTLSRGLTLEGLFVSFFARASNAYDTLLQMGRWFGYRPDYEDLQRVWLSRGLDDDYRFLATVEVEMRDEIARMTGAGETPEHLGVRVRMHPGRLQITSPAKMKHAKIAHVDFEGSQLQTTRFDARDPRTFAPNTRTARALRHRLESFRHTRDSALYRDVPIEALTEFFSEFAVEARFADNFRGVFEWASEWLPQKRWNVVIPFDDAEDRFRLVERAPIAGHTGDLAANGIIDIRALRTGGDLVSDLKLMGAMTDGRTPNNSDQLKLRQDRAGLDGCGLLQLYPIDRFSPARNPDTRMDMQTALKTIDTALTGDKEPIIGVALVSPIDTSSILRARGTKVSVHPVFGDADEVESETVVDIEGDFRGADL